VTQEPSYLSGYLDDLDEGYPQTSRFRTQRRADALWQRLRDQAAAGREASQDDA
jgi:hypothetical protein